MENALRRLWQAIPPLDRPFFLASVTAIGERWRQGESLHAIARLFDRNNASIGGILSRTGGIRPLARRRSALALKLSEREEISRGVMAGRSMRTMARALGRAPSTVSREIRRNGGCQSYRASEADASAWQRAGRPKRCKLAQNRALARLVAEKLRLQWSPYQVAGWLKRMYPQDETRQVSHETIYLTLFIQALGALKKELLQHLRRTRAMRRSRHHTQKTGNHGRITETVSIRIYDTARAASTPALNALASLVLFTTLIAVGAGFVIYRSLTRGERKGSSGLESFAAQL